MPDNESKTRPEADLVRIMVIIIVAYLRKNPIAGQELPKAIRAVYASLAGIVTLSRKQKSLKPAVPIAKSVLPDGIICLEDGKKLKMMKRYLRSKYNLSPQQYRSKWGLSPDYPMVSPNYAARRSNFAKKNGLGKKKT